MQLFAVGYGDGWSSQNHRVFPRRTFTSASEWRETVYIIVRMDMKLTVLAFCRNVNMLIFLFILVLAAHFKVDCVMSPCFTIFCFLTFFCCRLLFRCD